MKAYVLAAPSDLRYREVEKPQCRPGWVLVQVKAAGICSSDIPRIFVKGTYHFPTIPGMNFQASLFRLRMTPVRHGWENGSAFFL